MKNTTGEEAGISSDENGTITIAERNGGEEEEAGNPGKTGETGETLRLEVVASCLLLLNIICQ